MTSGVQSLCFQDTLIQAYRNIFAKYEIKILYMNIIDTKGSIFYILKLKDVILLNSFTICCLSQQVST